jgi:hypothetical protein
MVNRWSSKELTFYKKRFIISPDMKKLHGFNIGDMVYAHTNSLWARFGMKPMKVISVGPEGIGCEHPDSPGVCWFYASECQLVTPDRKLALAELQAKMDEVNRLKKSLFKD